MILCFAHFKEANAKMRADIFPINSRKRELKFPITWPRELPRKALISIFIFCAQAALIGRNRKISRFYGNCRELVLAKRPAANGAMSIEGGRPATRSATILPVIGAAVMPTWPWPKAYTTSGVAREAPTTGNESGRLGRW